MDSPNVGEETMAEKKNARATARAASYHRSRRNVLTGITASAALLATTACAPANPAEEITTPFIPTGTVEKIAPGQSINRTMTDPPSTIILSPGFHKWIDLYNVHASENLTITGEGRARVPYIKCTKSSNIEFKDMDVWGDVPKGGGWQVLAQSGSSNINFSGLNVRSVPDAINYMSWDKEAWLRNSVGGITYNRSTGLIENCSATGVGFGIIGKNIQNCKVMGFAGDAYRAFGNCRVIGNHAQDSVNVSGNHDDLFQSFNLTGTPFMDMWIKENTFISWTGDFSHPLAHINCQGIGMFDGFFEDLIIENNIVITDHWHGISVFGMTNGLIAGNTVLNVLGANATERRPWIMISKHKDGQPSIGNVMRDNIANRYATGGTAEESGNITVSKADTQSHLDNLNLVQ